MSGARCLPVAAIRPSTLTPRRAVAEGGLCDLAASMQRNGLLHPIVVYPTGGGGGADRTDRSDPSDRTPPPEEFVLIAGERRLRAAKVLAWEMIPATVRQEPTEEEARTLHLVENLQRQDLDPIEEALALRQLYEGGMPQGRIARQIGRTQGYVSNRLRLLRLPESIQTMLASGALSVEWGETLLAWESEPERGEILARDARDGRLRLSELKDRARREGRVRERGGKGGEGPALPDREGGGREGALPMQVQSALEAVPAAKDCRRLALVAAAALVDVPNRILRRLCQERDLEHLLPYLTQSASAPPEEGWEALAALSAERLLDLASAAVLATDLDYWAEVGEPARAARWYAGVEP